MSWVLAVQVCTAFALMPSEGPAGTCLHRVPIKTVSQSQRQCTEQAAYWVEKSPYSSIYNPAPKSTFVVRVFPVTHATCKEVK